MEENEEYNCTPEEICAVAQEVSENLLPEKSRRLYNRTYDSFMTWRLTNKVGSFSENVMLAYFQTLLGKFKPSTLWTEYSKLKSTIAIYHQVDISKYSKLLAFLKRKSEGFKAKKARTFTPDELKMFIDDAPDRIYLLTKVTVIFGIMGACRRQELHNLKLSDVIDLDNTLVVNVMNTKNRIDRTFTITGKYYQIIKKYLDLRPNPCNNPNFFLRYANGKCYVQNIGINTFGQMGKTVAAQLKLQDPELYTGHCFRRTSATILVDAGGDVTSLKRHGGWKSTTVAEGYIDNSIKSRIKVSNLLMTSIDNIEQPESTPRNSSSSQFNNKTTTYIPPTMNHQQPPVYDLSPTYTPNSQFTVNMNPLSPATPASINSSTSDSNAPTLSQIINQNADININKKISTSSPSITISHNTIHNLHVHFHK